MHNLTLHCIASGFTDDATVNGDGAQQVGKKVLEGMVGKTTAHTHSRKNPDLPPQQKQYHQSTTHMTSSSHLHTQ